MIRFFLVLNLKNVFLLFLWAEVGRIFFIWVLNLSPSSEAYRGAAYMLVYTTLIRLFLLLDFFVSGSVEVIFIWTSFIVFRAIIFLAKLPLYWLHYWLPKVHVEATTVVSAILRGLLLKIGVFTISSGIIVFSSILLVFPVFTWLYYTNDVKV